MCSVSEGSLDPACKRCEARHDDDSKYSASSAISGRPTDGAEPWFSMTSVLIVE